MSYACRGFGAPCDQQVKHPLWRCETCRAKVARAHDADRRSRHRDPEAQRSAGRRYEAAHPEKSRERQRRRKAGFSGELVKRCQEAQDDVCAICRQPWEVFRDGRTTMCADHDHATGAPRGLLCHHCNIGLGRYEKYQARTIRIEPYDTYLANPPARGL